MQLVLTVRSTSAGNTERVFATPASAPFNRGHRGTVVGDAGRGTGYYRSAEGIARIALDSPSDSTGSRSRTCCNVVRLTRLGIEIRTLQSGALIAFGDISSLITPLARVGIELPLAVFERTDPRQNRQPWMLRMLRRLLYPFADLETAIDLLLKAYARAQSLAASWQLVILGEGSERTALRRRNGQLGLQGAVLVPSVVKYAALFVLSSPFGGFPSALLEAMQCGLPVATFDCPSGPGEIVHHKQTGLLVADGEVDALAAAIAWIASDADLRRRLGSAAAVDVASRFSLQHVASMREEWLVGVAGQAQ